MSPEPSTKAKRRFVMSLVPGDEENLSIIVNHYRRVAGFDVRIAEIQRHIWADEVQRIKRMAPQK